ncbi:MAG: heme lyase CcmF/NrfE family subunit [Methylacidiphilales bacterium]|nr:heme lyase CcmF/NrfE family subunit [Candidatus Methylacidiphilales bacterium]
MLPEIAHYLLILSLVVACRILYVAVLPSAVSRQKQILQVCWLFGGCIVTSYILLTISFVLDDFSILYITNNSSTELNFWYKISAVWGAHEGSFFFWMVIYTLWFLLASNTSAIFDQPWRYTMIAILAGIAIGFISFIVFSSNPFTRTFTPLEQGFDLNPLLQDPGLIFHPPLLYLGYIGMSVPYAFSLAMLIHGLKPSQDQLQWLRNWVLGSFLFLSLGIALGSFWAYYELGWGGWWFWDPVENASLMPWLVSIALIHVLGIALKRNIAHHWVCWLSVLGFCLSVLGTFLVRSGIIISVHSFASDPTRGVYILALLFLLCVPALFLLLIRGPILRDNPEYRFELYSRETAMFIGVIITLTLLFVVALGTLYPLVIDLLSIGKISVGPPYFNKVFVPISLLLFFIMALAPTIRWQQDAFARIRVPIAIASASGILASIAIYLYSASLGFATLCGLGIITLVYSVRAILDRKISSGLKLLQFFYNQSGRWYAMNIAHLAMVLLLFSITTVSMWGDEKELWVSTQEPISVGPYTVILHSITNSQNPQFQSQQATVHLKDSSGQLITSKVTEKRNYLIRNQPTTETAIFPLWHGDIFIALGSVSELGDKAQLRVQWKPMIRGIWISFLLFAIAAALGMFARVKKKNIL